MQFSHSSLHSHPLSLALYPLLHWCYSIALPLLVPAWQWHAGAKGAVFWHCPPHRDGSSSQVSLCSLSTEAAPVVVLMSLSLKWSSSTSNCIHCLHMVNPWGRAWRLAARFLLRSLFPQIITTAESSSFPSSCKSVHANWHLRATRCTALLGTLLKLSLGACSISISARDRLYIMCTQSREVFTNWFITTSAMKWNHLIMCSWEKKKKTCTWKPKHIYMSKWHKEKNATHCATRLTIWQ